MDSEGHQVTMTAIIDVNRIAELEGEIGRCVGGGKLRA
jgi:hypothetical protein